MFCANTASLARKLGRPVSGFQRETYDGRAVVIFVCGELRATDTVDERFVEVIVAGRRLTPLPVAVAELVLHDSTLYTASELLQECRMIAAAHADAHETDRP